LDLQLVSEIHWPSAGLLKSVGSKSAALPWWSIPGFLPFCDKALASAQTILAYLSHELIPQGCLSPLRGFGSGMLGQGFDNRINRTIGLSFGYPLECLGANPRQERLLAKHIVSKHSLNDRLANVVSCEFAFADAHPVGPNVAIRHPDDVDWSTMNFSD
jgi:hypothetical protein